MSLIPVSFGPLLGDVNATDIKIWSALDSEVSELDKPNIGRLRYRKVGANRWGKTLTFRFNAAFQYTAVIQLRELEPGTCYQYQIGYQSSETSAAKWHGAHPIETFTTINLPENQDNLSFALGSCLYPRESFVALNNRSLGIDKAFRHVTHWHQTDGLSMMVLMGDQIYADTGNAFDAATSMEEFTAHYHRLYRGAYFAKAVANVPTYMMMDDHEIHDKFTAGGDAFVNQIPKWKIWLGLASKKINGRRFINGLAAFNAFQAVHGPIFNDVELASNKVGFVKGQDGSDLVSRYYYEKQFGNCDFFFTDTRLERTSKGIMSDEQCDRLIHWLINSKAKVKFIVSAVTFLVDSRSSWLEKDDNWAIDIKRRNRILDAILKMDIKNVVFLAGDIHASFMTTLRYKGQALPVHQIACSGLYWPVGGLNGEVGSRFRWQRHKVKFNKRMKGTFNYSVGEPFSQTTTDYYCGNGIGRIDVSSDKLTFSVAARKDKPGSPYRLTAEVSLA